MEIDFIKQELTDYHKSKKNSEESLYLSRKIFNLQYFTQKIQTFRRFPPSNLTGKLSLP